MNVTTTGVGSGSSTTTRMVLGSLAAGAAASVALVAAPFIPADEEGVTAAVLLGSALGWSLLAARSTGDQRQRWAVVPALFMGLSGLVVLAAPPSFVHGTLAWVWPPALLGLVAWMVRHARHDVRGRARRWVLYPAFALLALAAVGGGYGTVRESVDARAHAMPGQLVDVGGHRMHLHCTGTGSPTVVLEPGAGEMSAFLGWVEPEVARDTRVCVYDRAGRGWSEPTDGPHDAGRIAADLRGLLRGAGVPGPYVLAGHSFGGLYVLTYAARYPDDVAGLVLIDSTAPTAGPAPQTGASSYDLPGRLSAVASAAARLGLGRLIAQVSYATLPPASRAVARASAATADHLGSVIDEYAAATASTQQAGSLTDLAGKPLVVLTAGTGSSPGWFADQDHLATLSTNSLHRIVANASHASLLEEQSDAAAVTRAIHDAVSAVRTAGALPAA